MNYYLKMCNGDVVVERLNTHGLVPVEVQASNYRSTVAGNARELGYRIVDEWWEETAQ